MESLRERVLPLIAPTVERFGLDLVDLELKGSKSNLILRVIVDGEGGVLVDACAALSRAIADELDIADVIPGRYRLEVSSPGTDRPLRTPRDFQRNRGREVLVRYRQGVVVVEEEGIIRSASAEELLLEDAGRELAIPLANIEFGKIRVKL